MRLHFSLLALLYLGLWYSPASAAEPSVVPPEPLLTPAEFIAEATRKTDIGAAELEQMLAAARFSPAVYEAIQTPWEARPWHEYYPLFLTSERLNAGLAFWSEHADTLARASEEFGVPAAIIVAIIGIETYYGRYTGEHRVLDALYTLGFYYGPRADFFRRELAEFLRLSHEENIPVTTMTGSYAGAMGLGQFIASSYRHYAVDYSGDGQRNLLENPADAIGSVANYLAEHRWQAGQPILEPAWPGPEANTDLLVEARGQQLTHTVAELQAANIHFITVAESDTAARLFRFAEADGYSWAVGLPNFYAITRYNHSPLYARTVVEFARQLERAR